MLDKQYEILIVDDNPENLRVLSSLLTREGYKVRVAKNGTQALATINESEPDLMLLDIQMPELDGFEVCKKIKLNSDYSDFPILFISALGDNFNKIKGFEVGAVDYIPKPFDADEVKARVRINIQVKTSMEEIQLLKEELKKKDTEIQYLKQQLGLH